MPRLELAAHRQTVADQQQLHATRLAGSDIGRRHGRHGRRSSPRSGRPASRPRCSTADAARRCRRRPAQPVSHGTARRAHRPAARGARGGERDRAGRRRARRPARAEGARRPVARRGCACCAQAPTLRAASPATAPSDARPFSASTTRRCSHDLHVGDRVVLGDGAISLRVESVDEPTASDAASSPAGGRRAGPGVHLPSERLRLHAPTDDDLVLGRGDGGRGRRLPRGLVRARGRRPAHGPRRGRCRTRPHLVAKIETLPAVDRARGDRRRGRRDHGGPRRPRHRVPARGRAAPAEADHPPLRRGRRAGHHRDADDGEHDHRRRRRRGPR